jgi:hypothetical protein
MVLNLVNAILNLSDVKASFGFMKIIWLILGTISIVILYNSILKKQEWIKYHRPNKRVESAGFLEEKIFYRIKEWKNRDLLE